MSDDRMKALEAKIVNAEADRALQSAGLPAGVLRPHVARYLHVTDGGEVRTSSGQTADAVIEALRKDPELAPVFGSDDERPSWEGKKFSEMTIEEKAQYTQEKYG